MPLTYQGVELYSEQELAKLDESIKSTGQTMVLRVAPDPSDAGKRLIAIARVTDMNFATAELAGLLREINANVPYSAAPSEARLHMIQIADLENLAATLD